MLPQYFKTLPLVLALCIVFFATKAQTTYLHTANTTNISSNWTILNHPELDNRPDAIVIVTSNWKTTGPYHNKSIGVWYNNGRWTIFNQDLSPMTNGAMFNVLIASPSANAFKTTVAQRSGHIAILDHPSLNGRPNAKFLVTPDWGNTGPYNNNPIGIWYNGSKWTVYNQKTTNPMPANPRFNVFIDDRIFVFEANNAVGNWQTFDNPATNNQAGALVFASQYWTAVYNPHEIGVWYTNGRWAVYNQDLAALPRSAKFFLWTSGTNTPPPSATCPTVPNATWFNPLRSGLSTAAVRVNNYTPRQNEFNPTGERAFLRPNDCFFRVNMGASTFRLPFTIDMVEGGPDNRCKAYINDWNSNSVRVSTSGGRILVRLDFESAGTELVTNCYNNGCCEGNPFCPGAGCPDYELNRAWVEMYLTPVLSGGRLDYTHEVVFNVDVRELGNDPCTNNFWAFLCDWGFVPRVGDRQNRIRQAIESNIRAQFNNATLRLAINAAMNDAVRSAGVDLSRCSSVSIDGTGNLVFR